MKLLFLFLFLINIYSKIYKLFNFHKLILIENNKDKYLMDFAPIVDITKPNNIIKLLSNQNVQGKIYI